MNLGTRKFQATLQFCLLRLDRPVH